MKGNELKRQGLGEKDASAQQMAKSMTKTNCILTNKGNSLKAEVGFFVMKYMNDLNLSN